MESRKNSEHDIHLQHIPGPRECSGPKESSVAWIPGHYQALIGPNNGPNNRRY